jgi:hypothetical protein
MRPFRLAMVLALIGAATACQTEIPLRRPAKPQATHVEGGTEADTDSTDSTTSSTSGDEAAPRRRFSKDAISNAQMFGPMMQPTYRDSPIP